MSLSLKVEIELSDLDLLASRGLEKGGRVQRMVDAAVILYSVPYCPMDTGTLRYSPFSAAEIGSGKIIYPGPYAHYQYYEEVYGPNIPVFGDNSGVPTRFFSPKGQKKHPTGRRLDYSKSKARNGPLAGAFWFERMKADHMEDILAEVKKAVSHK